MEFPNMTGLSTRNLKYMRQFAETYDNYEIVQQVAAQIPWFHNVVIMEKVKNSDERFFYIRKTVQNGWSRNVLNFQIASGLYQRQIENKNQKITNFNLTLPKEDSELALEIVKDPYNFEFLSVVRHFEGSLKPWLSNTDCKGYSISNFEDFWFFAEMTNFYENIKLGYINNLIPKRTYIENIKMKLFDRILFLKIINININTKTYYKLFKLFGFIPLLKIKNSHNKTCYKLLNFIPLIKIIKK